MVSPTLLRTLTQSLNFALVLSTAFMLWKSLSVLADSHSPIVVVLSGSMEPAFQRGDLLFLWNRNGLFPESIPCVFGIGGIEKCGDAGGTLGDGSEGVKPKGAESLVRDAAGKMGVKKEEGGLRGPGERKDARVGEIVVYEVRGKDIPIVHRVVRRFGGGDEPLLLLTKGDNNAADDTELYARGQKYLDRDRDVIGSVVGFVPYVGYGTILLSEYPWLKTAMLGLMGLTVVLQRE